MQKNVWSTGLSAVQFRVARPTHQLDKIVTFYREGLGLKEVGSFQGHEGYDGVIFGLPDEKYQLEFTQYTDAVPILPPSEDNLLVFYMPDEAERDRVAKRLASMGHPAVKPENPYWRANGVTLCDPDGWRIVLQHGSGL
ncbi:catechol 2,3-dioxygenase-like lactoylglutathione lyase family enzyme [Paenibacillus shirakamiensis]|uniref:Catechol 2,3-dioxygenase-like lactoylglutathione lyase family enzyme n=1 Tax=Paenibacillus shirakamiensis TaxID=1265935 RepID=A0ABS4JIF4_9BACL|nr:VOC family protein [Paenibacillus shirakamiensis]MBP2001504.1 catechol 2,3-dioxygenase-like lactoylglutathione lyase family enzyme [Paenibacillus shirakamiensis]